MLYCIGKNDKVFMVLDLIISCSYRISDHPLSPFVGKQSFTMYVLTTAWSSKWEGKMAQLVLPLSP